MTEGQAGRTQMSFTITLSAASTQSVWVNWATGNGTGTAGSDYLAAGGAVRFDAGQRTTVVRVWVLGDRVREADETFFVTLSVPIRATIATGAGRATGTIVNDDAPATMRATLAAAFASLETSAASKGRK